MVGKNMWGYLLPPPPPRIDRDKVLLGLRMNRYSVFLTIMCISSFHLSNPLEIVTHISDKLCKL